MPKRNINLFTEEEEVDYKISDLFTEDELLQDQKCYEILENQFFFDFEEKMAKEIHLLFNYFNNIYCHKDFLYDNYDYVGDDFLPILYKHICKKYDFDLLYENPSFTNHLFDVKEETKKNSKKVKTNIIIGNTKKHVWG